MPELPEVENVRRDLERVLCDRPRLIAAEFYRKDLRFPFPKRAIKGIEGSALKQLRRRAKYLLFDFEGGTLLSHLGMTGQWRVSDGKDLAKKHDHVQLQLSHAKGEASENLFLTYNDSRRFGFLQFLPDAEAEALRFKDLGPEPLECDPQALWSASRRSQSPIKHFIMDQKVIVGVGNIYASEALFAAGIRPSKPASQMSRGQVAKLLAEIQRILRAAIAAGGSTIRNYARVDRSEGGFQNQHLVYGKEGCPCVRCGRSIRRGVSAGRSAFWCPQCQR